MSPASKPGVDRQSDLFPVEPEPIRTDAQELLADLNAAQRAAVVHGDGALSILAGAGSGKTRVITRRIAYLVRARGLRPDEIVAITFTNKAAGEMRERVAALLPDVGARGTWLSTFHSLCARILRRDIELLGAGADGARYTRDFSIYDTDDRNRLIKDLIQREGFDTTRFKPAAIGAWISHRKNQGERLLAGHGRAPAARKVGLDDDVFGRVAGKYERAMASSNALDFDDLLLKVLELFEQHPGARDGYARRFRHVMVDEYQDTNTVQYVLMRHLACHHHNVTVCGDPDQSIYAWRGADVRNILEFERDFPGAAVVRLEQNYRSTQVILRAAQSVIRNNRQRKEKDLWSQREGGAPIYAVACADEDDEAREIASQIRGLQARGTELDDVAIFYRANFMQRALERALRLSSLPYQIVAGTEFFQRREIKDLVAWLRVIVNQADDEACSRAMRAPSRGIGERSLEELATWRESRRVPLLRAASSTEARALVRGKARKALEDFAARVERLSALRDGPAHAALQAVVAETEYYRWLDESSQRDDVDRAANVEELLSNAAVYDEREPDGGLRGFLQDIALVSDADGGEQGARKISMMTLHAAKGLEFAAVFIAGVEEELVPHSRALSEADDPDAAIEEERRLFYVGMTRAQDRLFLTHAQVRRTFGDSNWRTPSRFLREIPPEAIEGGGSPAVGDGPSHGMVAEPEDAFESDLKPGAWVEHDHFGRGVVLRLSGSGANARATVRFPLYGEKMLILQYAKLRRLDADSEDAF